MTEYTINERSYAVGKLTAMTSAHLASKLASILILLGNRKPVKDGESLNPQELGKALCVLTSTLPQADRELMITECLAVVQRQQANGNWAPVSTNGMLLFADITFDELYQLTWLVLDDNRLPAFFTEPVPKALS